MHTEATSFQHIGVFRLSALGDVVLVVPMIRALQASFPQARITWIIDHSVYGILEGLTGVDFVVIDKPRSLKDFVAFRDKIKAYKFDVLLAMQASLRANLMYPLISAKRKIGFDRQRSRDLHHYFVKESIRPREEHLLDGFMAFAQHIGAARPSNIHWDLPISIDARQQLASKIAEPYVVLHPAASKSERNWSVLNYQRLIAAIHEKYPQLKIILTGAPSDIALTSQLTQHLPFVSSLAGKTSLKQLTVILQQAQCLIAPDTGAAHIATAVNTPIIGLYAVITAKLSGPYLFQHLVIDKYPQAVRRFLKTEPSTVKWGTRVHQAEAMSLISVDEVMDKMEGVLGNGVGT